MRVIKGMASDERFLAAAQRREEDMVRFLADLIERQSLSRREREVVQRIGDEMTALGFDEVFVKLVEKLEPTAR